MLPLSEAVRFTPKRSGNNAAGGKRPGSSPSISAVPLTVEFGRLLRGDREARRAEAAEWARIAGLSTDSTSSSPMDLLHAVVALYDTSLPEASGQSLYRTLCADGARTLLVLRDTQEILREWELHVPGGQTPSSRDESFSEINNNPLGSPGLDKVPSSTPTPDPPTPKRSSSLLNGNTGSPVHDEWQHWTSSRTKRTSPEPSMAFLTRPPRLEERTEESPFSDIFSDSGAESDSGSEMEQEDDPAEELSRGLNQFLKGVAVRRAERKTALERWSLQPKHVGVEHRLIGAATCYKNYKIPGIKVVYISLIAVRKRYRKCGIGRFLLKRLKSPSVVGPYDALVVQADSTSSTFFLKHGFTDDVILCSRFRDLEDKWDHTALLCYLPPFDGHYPLLPGVQEWNKPDSVQAMQEEVDRWRQKSLEAYQAQITCLTRLQHEVVRLHAILQRQESTIQILKRENQKLQSKLNKGVPFVAAEKRSTHALLEALEKEAADFERLCSFQSEAVGDGI